ncbi:glycosyltransferase family 4 protein [Fictibacillus phosphorivorans]|uniref:glycosyltransferase family 4 protein n=1 Tax=Fictibacillus phosphorivorans TaxID=1221500 RepID=UPI003CF2B169
MKVLHVISGGETGGSKNHILSLLQGLPKKEVMLCVFQEGLLYEQAKQLGIEVKILKQKSRYDLSILTRFKKLIRENQIEIVHSHGARANLYCYFVSYFKQSFKWITTVHSDPRDDFIRGGIKGKVFTSINMHILKKINYFFAVSERFKQMLCEFGIKEEKIETIYNGIDFKKNFPSKLERSDIGLSDEDFVIIMVARLHPIKGHTEVFKALQKLVLKNTKVKLLLVGDGPIKDQLVEDVTSMNLEKNVEFLGFQSDVHSYFCIADIKILASYSESFPLVLLEAARANTPIISTDVGGVKNLINSEELGWVIPVKNIDSIEQALNEALEKKNKHLLDGMGKKLHDRAKEEFSIEKLVNQTYLHYKKILNGK